MVNITLLELNVDDANATFSAGGPGEEPDETEVLAGEEIDEAEEGGSGPPLVAALVGIVFAVGLAVAVRKFVLGGDEEPPDL